MSLFRKITETVSKGVSTATEKAQQTVEMTRLSVHVSAKHKDIERLFTQIGEAVYEGYLAKNLAQAEPKIIPACREIEKLRGEIERLEERIMALRNEKECECGRKVTFDARFCPACGRAFPKTEVSVVSIIPQEPGSEETRDGQPLLEPAALADQAQADADGEHHGKPPNDDARGESQAELADGPSTAGPLGEPQAELADRSSTAGPLGEPQAELADRSSTAGPLGEPQADLADRSSTAGPLGEPEAICKGCGKTLDASAKFCPSCGKAK